jgi:hypothetical protein
VAVVRGRGSGHRHRHRRRLHEDGDGLGRGDREGSRCGHGDVRGGVAGDVGLRGPRRFGNDFGARVAALRGVGCAAPRVVAVDDAVGDDDVFLFFDSDEAHGDEST